MEPLESLEHQGVLQMVQFQRALHPAPPARFMFFSPAQRRTAQRRNNSRMSRSSSAADSPGDLERKRCLGGVKQSEC